MREREKKTEPKKAYIRSILRARTYITNKSNNIQNNGAKQSTAKEKKKQAYVLKLL